MREIDRRRESDEEREIRGTSIIVKAQRGRERERESRISRRATLEKSRPGIIGLLP